MGQENRNKPSTAVQWRPECKLWSWPGEGGEDLPTPLNDLRRAEQIPLFRNDKEEEIKVESCRTKTKRLEVLNERDWVVGKRASEVWWDFATDVPLYERKTRLKISWRV
jgi:hypothetical protein